MHNRKILGHSWYYFVELLVLLFGFGLLFVLGSNIQIQLTVLAIILATYIGLGVLHHKIHHDLHPKIVVEYILISVLIFAAFVFLNITRL